MIGEKLDLCAKLNAATFHHFFLLPTVSFDLSGLICTQYLLLAKGLGVIGGQKHLV